MTDDEKGKAKKKGGLSQLALLNLHFAGNICTSMLTWNARVRYSAGFFT
jgi:hypothetical protein